MQLFLFTVLPIAVLGDWTDTLNGWDGELEYRPSGKALTGFQSWHDNNREDRQWKIQYADFPGQSGSMLLGSWTGFDNYFKEDWENTNKVLTGMLSSHSDFFEDRKFRMETTQVMDGWVNNCNWLSETSYDSYFNKTCGSGKYVAGMESTHSNPLEDRIWKFKCCEVTDTPKSSWTQCPVSHPFVYRPSAGFDYCCETNEDNYGNKFVSGSLPNNCAGSKYTVCSSPPCRNYITSSPTSAPTDEPTSAPTQSLDDHPWQTAVVGDDVYKCHDVEGCYVNRPDARGTWTLTERPNAQLAGNTALDTNDAKVSVDPEVGITIEITETGIQYLFPWTCTCNA